MKRSGLLAVISATCLVVGISIFTIELNKNSLNRSNYEKFLIGTASFLIDDSSDMSLKNPGMDSPDIAAYADFRKTIDPQLLRVPAERLVNAYQETKERSYLNTAKFYIKKFEENGE